MSKIIEKKNDFIYFVKALGSYDEHEYGSYNQDTGEVVVSFEVAGTQYEGRTERIEKVTLDDKVKVIRDKNNQYSEFNLAVENTNGESLGNLRADACECISPLLDEGILKIKESKVSFVEPLSKRGPRCKKAILYIELKMQLNEPKYNNKDYCTLCYVGGDQTKCWVQKLEIVKCNIPLEDAKLMFEVYNRLNGEYDNDDYSYLGLDNLVDEVKSHRKKIVKDMKKEFKYDNSSSKDDFYVSLIDICEKEPDRYKTIKKYFDVKEDEYDEYYSLRDFFDRKAVDVKTYYWIDQCRVSEDEWNSETGWGFSHWYDIVELYDVEKVLPFDLNDEEVVSIFGFNEFEAFADLSFGC